MNSRTRLLTALDGKEPDHIPCALSFYPIDLGSILPSGLNPKILPDIEFVKFPISKEELELTRIAKPFAGDTRIGTVDQARSYLVWRYRPHVQEHRNPLAMAESIEDLYQFPFPDTSSAYVVQGLTEQVKKLHSKGQAVGGNLPHLGGELFEAAWRLRGLENFLIDLIERPDWAHYLLDRLTDIARRNAETLARSGIDVLSLDDDVGMPGSMMISPKIWCKFFKPRLAEIIIAARGIKSDLRVLFHSDGYFEPIIEDLIEIGVNASNPIQPDHMDALLLRKRFGTNIALWGTVGTQTAFSFNTPKQIKDEVRFRIETLGRSALILCPAYDIDEPDIPSENVQAFLSAVAEFG